MWAMLTDSDSVYFLKNLFPNKNMISKGTYLVSFNIFLL